MVWSITDNSIKFCPSGLNELYIYYQVMDVPSNYYYSVKIVNNSVFLINKVGKIDNDIYTVDLVKPDITDDELKALAIDFDGFADKYSIEVQRISKRFIMNSMEFKYEVETVYKDKNGCFFCTLYTYES